MTTAESTKLEPFMITYTVTVECKEFERLDDETVDEARWALVEEIREGFKQTAYDLYWNIEDVSISEGVQA